MQESNKVANAVSQVNNKEQTPDEFKVGDVVYDLLYGKGEVVEILHKNNLYPVIVTFDVGAEDTFTHQGKRFAHQPCNRTIFFSEPKIEASVKRPFTPTLVGKTVVVREPACYDMMITITCEDEYSFGDEDNTFYKKNVEVFELGSKLI